MSNIHFLDKSGDALRVAVHLPMFTGQNSAGKDWKAVWIELQRNTTVLTTFHTNQAEIDQIVSGDVIEAVLVIDRFEGSVDSVGDFTALVQKKLTEFKDSFRLKYKHYGRAL